MIYGYCRISRKTQNIERQIRNIKNEYPDAHIVQEAFTGTKIYGRKEFIKLINGVKSGDSIVFDSVSRMSRNADDGVTLYFDLLSKGINLIFLKEHYIDTSVYEQNAQDKLPYMGTDEDLIFEGLNKYFKRLAEKQIRIAFDQAQKEVDDLRERTKEGIKTAKLNGKRVGIERGRKLVTKKSIKAKELIKKYNKTFDGTYDNEATWKKIGISKATFYKYKNEILQELSSECEE